jgi:hypothetical protein
MRKSSEYERAGIFGFVVLIIFNVLDYIFLDLPVLLKLVLNFLIVFIPVALTIILKARRDESSRFSVARGLGKVLACDDVSLSFERNGTIFNWEAIFSGHQASFYLPEVKEKFSIQHTMGANAAPVSVLGAILSNQSDDDSIESFSADCQIVKNSPLSDDITIYSRNPDFLLPLLNNPKVYAEINKYFPDRFGITFNNGNFKIGWETGSNEELEHFHQVCQSAILFHDEIKAAGQSKI